jgi:hypothetical protein
LQSFSALAYSVLEYGADPKGIADSTKAFRDALKAAGKSPVDVPSGKYKITGSLNITGQTLQGARNAAWGSDENGSDESGQKLSVLTLPTVDFFPFDEHGAANPFVKLGGGGAIHGLNVQYQWDSKSPSNVPPCIQIVGKSGARVTDMRIRSAWDAVSSVGTPNAGRYYLANIFIVDAHNYGVAMSQAKDFSSMDNIEVWNTVQGKQHQGYGTGFLIHGVDGLRASNLATFGTRVGVHVSSNIEGVQHKAWVSLSNIHTDRTHQSIVVDGSGNDISLVGVQAQSNGESLVVNGSNHQVRVSASRLKSNGAAAVDISGANVVTLSGSGLWRVFSRIPRKPALALSGKNT